MTVSSATHRPVRRILIVTALGVLASPPASHADSLDRAMDACVQAFVATSLPKEQPVVVEKLDDANQSLDSRSRTYRIILTATGRISGRQIAKGACVVDRTGEIISLNGRRPARSANSALAASEVAAAR